METYLYFYTIELILLFLSSIRKNSFFFFIAVFISILFSGFRHNVGYDYLNYVYFYEAYNEISFFEIEPLFKLVISIFRYFTNDHHYFLFFCSFVTISFIVLGIRKISVYQECSYMIFLLIPSLFLTSFSIVRFALAMSLFFYALASYIRGKNKIIFSIFSICSIGCHYTMLYMYIFFLFANSFFYVRYSSFFYCFLLFSSILLFYIEVPIFILQKLLVGKYLAYQEQMGSMTNFKIFFVFLFSIFIIIESRYMKSTIENNFLLNVVLFNSMIVMLFYSFPHVARIGYILSMFQVILIPNMISIDRKEKNKGRLYWKYISSSLLIGSYFLMPIIVLWTDISSDRNGFKFTPYDNFLFYMVGWK